MHRTHVPAAALVLLLAPLAISQPARPAPKPPAASRPSVHRDAPLEAILASAFESGDLSAARAGLVALFDQRIAYAPLAEREAFIGPAQWLRLASLIERSGAAGQTLWPRLKELPSFARELAFLIKPEDDPRKVAALALRLVQERPQDIEKFPAMAAAVCVVFDEDRRWEFGKAPDALEAFDYFVDNDSRMIMSTRETPAELLIFVVDILVPAFQLDWARARYNPATRFSKCYNDVPYDDDHFPGGKELKLKRVDPTLENILKVGGVCRHRAHFAEHIAKAYGVPAVCIRGSGSEAGHMWLGYLEINARSARWNLDAGRFGEYSDMTGQAVDPQTAKPLTDGELSLLAKASLVPVVDRRFAAALTDAQARLARLADSADYPPATPADADTPIPSPRTADIATRLALLDAAVAACPAHAAPWDALTAIAAKKQLPPDQVDHWADSAITLCAKEFPDFAVDVLAPMICSVEDPQAQDRLWTWAFDQFSGVGKSLTGKSQGRAPRRADLAARIRFSQAAMWDKAGRPDKAWDDYMDVIKRFPNSGNHIVSAARCCEQLLEKQHKPATEAVRLYADAFAHVDKPPASMSPEFLVASNWLRLGTRYATLLDSVGDAKAAAQVRKQLPIRTPASTKTRK